MIDHEKLEDRWHRLSTEGPITIGVTGEFNPLLQPPEWFDLERFKRSQKLAKKYFLSLNIAHFIGNILLVHLPDVLIPVLATGHSASPYMVFMRILSTVVHILSWYDDDPFDPNTKTHKSLMTVRRNCHMAVSRMMNAKYPRTDRQWLSQFDMVMTQWSLIGIVAIRPEECAFHGTTREEFEEYIYFWKVLGYCVGIHDRFNCCLDEFDESIEYLDICFQRCYKVHLDRQCEAVKVGMDLTEGVFLGINAVIPRWFFCFEGFMKYWYDSLNVRHPITLDRWQTRFSYHLWVFLVHYLLRIRPIYVAVSWLYFFLLHRLFAQMSGVKVYLDRKYGDVIYRLRSNYHIDPFNNTNANHDDDINNNNSNNGVDDDGNQFCGKINDDKPNKSDNNQQSYYQIDNYLYKPNV